jgi:hypothetical protein
MDLQLALRVLWRFRVIVALGLFLGILLALFAMVRVNLSSSPHFAYRTQPQYESTTTVFVTTHGFPWGSLTLRAGGKRADTPQGTINTDTLRDFASLYLQLATSNQVMGHLKESGPVNGTITAYPIFSPDNSTLPLIGLSAVATTPSGARNLAQRHLRAFQTWLVKRQEDAGTQPANRVVLQPVSGPLKAKLLRGRKMTKPILIFFAVLVATCGLAFVLENMRPRVRPPGPTVVEEEAPEQPERLTA